MRILCITPLGGDVDNQERADILASVAQPGTEIEFVSLSGDGPRHVEYHSYEALALPDMIKIVRGAADKYDAITYLDEVHAVGTGEEGLAIVRARDIHVLISDLKMPGIDGVEIAGLFKTKKIKTPVLVISGYLDNGIIGQLEASGVHHFLEKPAGVREVIAAAEKAMNNSTGH